jgi:hypothetical protein
MIDINYKGILWGFAIATMASIMLILMIMNAGCVTAAKEIYRDATATPAPTPTPIPTPILPPVPTPTPIPTVPTFAPHFVDPFTPGERWQGQWFKWDRPDVQGLKDMSVGIIAYRHKFTDKYTWYNNAMGQYMTQYPDDGKRYFVVWVHEEMFGENQTSDPGMWIFDQDSFILQVKQQMITVNPNSHNPVNRIKEFENYYDYYNTVIAPPFGYLIRFTKHSPETGGYEAEPLGWLRMGKGNAVDGYIIYEIPEDTKEEEILLHGGFSSFGNAYWRFNV